MIGDKEEKYQHRWLSGAFEYLVIRCNARALLLVKYKAKQEKKRKRK
jgi:hypothetical protein